MTSHASFQRFLDFCGSCGPQFSLDVCIFIYLFLILLYYKESYIDRQIDKQIDGYENAFLALSCVQLNRRSFILIQYTFQNSFKSEGNVYLGLVHPFVRHNSDRYSGHFRIVLCYLYCDKIYAIHDFSVWLRTGYSPVDSNGFCGHTGNSFLI